MNRNVFLYICIFFSVPSISTLQYPTCKSSTSIGKFIPIYFLLFDAIINGIVFLISLSDSLLLAYRNTSYICMLIPILQVH